MAHNLTLSQISLIYSIWAIPAETAGNGKDNICIKKKFFKCAIIVKAVQVNITNTYMKLQSMNWNISWRIKSLKFHHLYHYRSM